MMSSAGVLTFNLAAFSFSGLSLLEHLSLGLVSRPTVGTGIGATLLRNSRSSRCATRYMRFVSECSAVWVA